MKKLFFALLVSVSIKAYAITLSDIKNQVRIIIKDNDSTRRRYTDTMLLDFINEGQRDVINNTWLIANSTTITLTSGVTYYSLPSNAIEIIRVTKDYKLLNETTFDKADSVNDGSSWETNGGMPIEYFQDKTQPDVIGIKPFPNSSTSTGTVRIQYLAKATDLSSDSDIPFNSSNRYTSYHDILTYYVVTRIFMLEGDQSKLILYAQLYESRIQNMREKIEQKPNYIPGFSGQRSSVNK